MLLKHRNIILVFTCLRFSKSILIRILIGWLKKPNMLMNYTTEGNLHASVFNYKCLWCCRKASTFFEAVCINFYATKFCVQLKIRIRFHWESVQKLLKGTKKRFYSHIKTESYTHNFNKNIFFGNWKEFAKKD